MTEARTYMDGYSDGREWASAQLAAAQGQEPVGYVAAGFLALGEGKIKEYADSTYKVAVYAAPIPQPPAPSEAAREYMTGYSDAKEWAGATNQAQQAQSVPEPVLQWCDKCGEGTVQGLCRGKLDDCKFKQAQPERAPLSDAEIEDLRGEANRGYCIDKGDYFKAFRDAEQAHGIKQGGQQ